MQHAQQAVPLRRRVRGADTGKVRGRTRPGDHDLDAILLCTRQVADQPIRRAVRGDDARVAADLELLERLLGGLHHLPVVLRAHQDRHARAALRHRYLLRGDCRCEPVDRIALAPRQGARLEEW